MRELIINCVDITDKEALHELFAKSLSFPQWYGKNLDALHDCLTEVSEEVVIRICGYEILKEKFGKYASSFKKLLIETAHENSNLKIEIIRESV